MIHKKNLFKARLTQKKKRQWTAREKLFILTYLEKVPGASVCGTADKFHLEPKQIRDWRSKRQQLMLAQPHIKRLNCGPRSRYPEIEDEVIKWIKSLHHEQKIVSRSMIQIKAATLAKNTKYISQYLKIDSFKWSNKWLDSFMRRFRLSNR